MKKFLFVLLLLPTIRMAGQTTTPSPFAIVKIHAYSDAFRPGGVTAYYSDGTHTNISDSIGLQRNTRTLAYDTSATMIQLNLLNYFEKRGYSLTAVSGQEYFFHHR